MSEIEHQDKGFKEVRSHPDMLALQCGGCGNVVKKRRDSFLPGAHVAVCVLCHNSSTTIQLADGTTVQVGNAARAGSPS